MVSGQDGKFYVVSVFHNEGGYQLGAEGVARWLRALSILAEDLSPQGSSRPSEKPVPGELILFCPPPAPGMHEVHRCKSAQRQSKPGAVVHIFNPALRRQSRWVDLCRLGQPGLPSEF